MPLKKRKNSSNQKQKKGIVPMKTALALVNEMEDTFCIYKYGEDPILCREVYTRKQLIEKFDLKNTMVVSIRPYFICGELEGVTFILEG